MKKPMKPSMKKPVKKADGGSIAGSAPVSKRTAPMPNPSAGGIGRGMGRPMPMPNPSGRGMGRPMPMPNPRAKEVASPKARFNRPGAMPLPGDRGGPPITTMPISPLKKGGMPMRKAKGGMAKGKKK